MDLTLKLIDDIVNLPAKVMDFFDTASEAIVDVIDAMNQFYELLMDFDNDIQAMTAACNTGTFNGLPINTAIGTFRYLVGDLVFFIIYISILVGCLFTIYKLVTKILDAVDAIFLQLTGNTCKSFLASLLGKLTFK